MTSAAAGPGSARDAAMDALRQAVEGLEAEEPDAYHVVVVLPGENKQRTACSLRVGEHSLSLNAFVARCPDENHAGVHAWLLARNLRMYAVAFALDHLGDVYLTGRLPLEAVTTDEVDRLLGSVLEYADSAFPVILELGFAGAIRREWAWRLSRGEPTTNLESFRHLAEPDPRRQQPAQDAGVSDPGGSGRMRP